MGSSPSKQKKAKQKAGNNDTAVSNENSSVKTSVEDSNTDIISVNENAQARKLETELSQEDYLDRLNVSDGYGSRGQSNVLVSDSDRVIKPVHSSKDEKETENHVHVDENHDPRQGPVASGDGLSSGLGPTSNEEADQVTEHTNAKPIPVEYVVNVNKAESESNETKTELSQTKQDDSEAVTSEDKLDSENEEDDSPEAESKQINSADFPSDIRTGIEKEEHTEETAAPTEAQSANTKPNPMEYILDIEDETEDVPELAMANYNRKIPTLKWKDIVPFCYSVDNPRRGKAIVINNEYFNNQTKRTGTWVDCTKISSRLRKLGFEVIGYNDVTCEEILAAFSQVAREDHSDADCFACVILSHGDTNGIHGTDGIITLDTIFRKFHASNCPTLAGKPKLFFIQACRGFEFDDGVELPVDVTDAEGAFSFPEEEVEYSVPDEADFLISYSTTEGYYSWRNARKGSWYIQTLVDVLDNFGTVGEVQKLLTKVNRGVSQNFKSQDPSHKNKTQMPSYTSTLTKDLYFVPK